MPKNGSASKMPWVIAIMLGLIALAAIMWRPSQPGLIPLGVSTRADVAIVGNEKECAADPMTVIIDSVDAVCFTNTLREEVTLEFDVPVLWGGQLVSRLPVSPGHTECFKQDPNSPVNNIGYDVFVGSTKCSDTTHRPKIIINPPGGSGLPTPLPT